jgi:hypothetical protein
MSDCLLRRLSSNQETCPDLPSFQTPSQTFTITAQNVDGTTDTGYTGTVHFGRSDSTAKLPAHYTFRAFDRGTHIFGGLVLKKKGQRSIKASDTLFSSITGSLSVDGS